jgi:protein subunit release factor B
MKEELLSRMERLGIREDDLVEKFILGSGRGGQKINKTSSCVYLKHIPSGVEVKCQRDRSRELNRYHARKELCEKIERNILKQKTEKDHEIAKIRRQKKRRSRKTQLKILENKRAHSEKKKRRSSPSLPQE